MPLYKGSGGGLEETPLSGYNSGYWQILYFYLCIIFRGQLSLKGNEPDTFKSDKAENENGSTPWMEGY